jgi:hypothetical protein
VYAFNTDSMRGLGLAIDLLDKGVNVYRAKSGFNAGGAQFFTGAALVDGASLAASGADISALAAARDTPVTGLGNYPVGHYQMRVPKIGLYTGGATIPSYPFNRTGTADGHCGVGGNSSFCQAMFTLAVKDKIPLSRITAITSADLANGKLVADGYTAFINPAGNITTGTTTDNSNPCPTFTPNVTGLGLREFVNGGGIYIGSLNGGYTTARCLLMAPNVGTVDTQGGRLLTPGSMFDGDFDTSNPVAWGFDLGSWIYRESNGDLIFDKDQLTGTQGKAVVSFSPSVATNPGHYGYQLNAAGLAGRPAVIDTPTGSGHAVVMGFDPFYRAWRESDERLVLNAALYPMGAEIAATEPSPATAGPAPAAIAPAAAPEAKKALAKSVSRKNSRTAKAVTRDVLIRVKRADAAKLKAAVKKAKLSKSVAKKVSYRTTRTTVTLVVKGARTSNEHARRAWVSRIQNALTKSKVKAIDALL